MKDLTTESIGKITRHWLLDNQPPPDKACPICHCLESAKWLETYAMCELCYKATRERRERNERVAAMWFNAHLPKSAQGFAFTNMDQDKTDPKAIQACDDWQYQPSGLYLWGPAGVGKTRLALTIAARELIQNQRRLLFLDLPQLFADLKESFQTDSPEPRRLLKTARAVPLLVLDDIGVGHSRDFGENEILPIINARNDEGLPTIYTSNLSWSRRNTVKGFETLEDKLGARVAQRIIHSAKAVWVIGRSNWLWRDDANTDVKRQEKD